MPLFPRFRRGRRSLPLILLAAGSLAYLAVFGPPSGSNADDTGRSKSPSHDPTSGSGDRGDVDRRPGAASKIDVGGGGVAFTSEELRYVMFGEGEKTVSDDDPRYLNYIRTFVSRPTASVPRTIKDKSGRKHFSQAGQSSFVDKRLHQRRNGFFIECGAVDGETLSNSLFFELERNWTGLLVEANPAYYRTLLSKNRQAYVMGGCLSPTSQPRSLTFRPAGVFGGIGENMEKTHEDFVKRRRDGQTVVTVQCFPLSHVLHALGVDKIDYFSLDVEGPEVEILRTIDWSRVRIDILTIEYRVITPVPRIMVDVEATAKKLDDLKQFFNATGLYRQVATLNTLDVVFERRDLTTSG